MLAGDNGGECGEGGEQEEEDKEEEEHGNPMLFPTTTRTSLTGRRVS
jgi:hypothetical protein